jgi:hypothetical protein
MYRSTLGRTSKIGEDLGSFRKTVFFYSSQINNPVGYSAQKNLGGSPAIILLGQSHMKEHRLGAGCPTNPYRTRSLELLASSDS